MSTTNVRSALVQRLVDLDLVPPIAYENVGFDLPSSRSWLRFSFSPVSTGPVTLGGGGDDEVVGLAQIDVFTPTNTGTQEAYSIAETVKNTFVVGNIFTYGSTNVRIRSAHINVVGTIENQYQVTVTVNWSAYLIRPLLT